MFQNVILAARFAENLADDLSGARPELRVSASIIVRDSQPNKFTYCVAVPLPRGWRANVSQNLDG